MLYALLRLVSSPQHIRRLKSDLMWQVNYTSSYMYSSVEKDILFQGQEFRTFCPMKEQRVKNFHWAMVLLDKC